MAYCFRRNDRNLTETLHRVAGSELAAVLAALEGGAPAPAGVHDMRKRIKKLRGLLRLMRSGLREAKAEIAVLREAALNLSGLRDAEVMLGWHDRLAPGVSGPLRDALVRQVEGARADADLPGRMAAAHAALSALAGRVPQWRVRGRDAEVLAAGLMRSLTRGGDAMTVARATRHPEALHDWRKRVKDLWYQARLLSPVWPDGIAPWQRTADDLGEALGDHHDLAVFLAMADRLADMTTPEGTALRATAQRLSADLEARAMDLGQRLYSAPAETVTDLWLAWWRAWR